MRFFAALTALATLAASATAVAPGIYRLHSVTAPGSVATAPSVGAPVVVSPNTNSTNQFWIVSGGSTGSNFQIQNVGTKDFLVAPGFPVIGTTIVGSTTPFNWQIPADGSASRITVVSASTSLAVTFVDTSVTGVSLRVNSGVTGDAQGWIFEQVAVAPGLYHITNTPSSTVLDLCLCSAGSSVPLVGIAQTTSATQKWNVALLSSGAYTIQNAGSGVFAGAPGSPVIGTTVVTDPSVANFPWTIALDAASGAFSIGTGSLVVDLTVPGAQGAATSLALKGASLAAGEQWQFVATS